MAIIPLDKSNLDLFVGYCYVARKEPNPHLLHGTLRKQNLYTGKIEDGLRGLLAMEGGAVRGIVEWMPLETSHLGFELPGAIYLHCIWVRPEYTGEGSGKALMEGLLDECVDAPLITFGYDYPDHMPRAFFEKHGFSIIEKHSDMYLMLRPGGGWDVERVRSKAPLIKPEAQHDRIKGRKPLNLYHNDFCPYNWLGLQRILEDVKGRRDISFRVFNCNYRKHGESCAEGPTLYLDGELITWHPCGKGFVKEILEKR